MLPPGIGLNAVSSKALRAGSAGQRAGYFEWRPALEVAETGMFPYTPPTSLITAASFVDFNGLMLRSAERRRDDSFGARAR